MFFRAHGLWERDQSSRDQAIEPIPSKYPLSGGGARHKWSWAEGGKDISEAEKIWMTVFLVLVRGRSSLYEADRSGGRAIIIAPKRMSRTAFIWFQLLGTLSTNTHPSWGLFQVYCDHILASTWPPPIPILNIIIFKISQTNVHLNFLADIFLFLWLF